MNVVNFDWQLQSQFQMPLSNRQVEVKPPQGMGMHMHIGDVDFGLYGGLVVGGVG